MEQYSLNGKWNMLGADGLEVSGQIPGSVYSFLIDAGRMKNPYYRDYEIDALKWMEYDFLFSRDFDLLEKIEEKRNPVLLSCEEESMQSQGLTCISEPGERHYSARFNVSNETWETVRGHVLLAVFFLLHQSFIASKIPT